MKLNFISSHKSIKFLSSIELPDFVVLTGVNGAGKSHFLQAIENGNIQIEGVVHAPHNIYGGQQKYVRLFNWTNIVPADTGAFSSYQSSQERSQIWTQASQIKRNLVSQVESLVARYSSLSKLSLQEIASLNTNSVALKEFGELEKTNLLASLDSAIKNVDQNFAQQFIQQDPLNRPRLLSKIQASSKFPLWAFEEEDFHANFPPSWQPIDMFQQSFARLFCEYQEIRRKNEYKKWKNSRGANFHVLEDEEFIEKYGNPPWDFVNSILESASLDFRVDAPDEIDDRPYEATLIHRTTNSRINFSDLSSGEKVLMSFAFCLYYANDGRQMVEYPQVLLFDEIDAPLHPSMTQSLLKTIQSVLVGKHKIKVIFTTHSPSTVALSPEDSIFALQKNENERLIKTSKDKALSILLSGVPSLSISYENRRQIFVESHYDAEFYEKLYRKIKPHLISEISLNFIAAGGAKLGGCDNVKSMVSKLSQAGNKTVAGIIDWDLKNKSEGAIQVLGEQERYSIENCLFDPLLIAALICSEKIVSKGEIGLSEDESYIDFRSMGNERLQNSINYVVNALYGSDGLKENDLIEVGYLSGGKCLVPKKIVFSKGHDLEALIKMKFPKLKSFHGEGSLKRIVLDRIVDDVPLIIPECVLNLFLKLQKL